MKQNTPQTANSVPNFCSFCEKSRAQAVKLIVSGQHSICDECVKLCNNLLMEQQNQDVKKNKNTNKFTNAQKIKQRLDECVIGQEEAKIALSVGVANHYKRSFYKSNVNVEKSNILLLGPTGSGKTLMAKSIASFLDVPFVIADATSLTETGYVGEDVESLLTRLITTAEGDLERAARGIIFIDEIDKISKRSERATRSDVGGEGVQQALLKMVEGSVINVPLEDGKRHPGTSTVQLDTSGILFIASGAFVGLDEFIDSRKTEKQLGFGSRQIKLIDKTAQILPQDLIKFGMIPEFVGRFAVTVQTTKLTHDDMVAILKMPYNNILEQFKFYFTVDGIQASFTTEALEAIAGKALDMKIGARALRSIIEQQLTPHLFALTKYKTQKVSEVLFTADCFLKNHQPILSFKRQVKVKKAVV